MDRPNLRAQAWDWLKANFDGVLARVPAHHGQARVLGLVGAFCDEAHAQDAEAFLGPRAAKIDGGPRALAQALEGVRLCAAKRQQQAPSARAFFDAMKKR
jgi:hypothetical protein